MQKPLLGKNPGTDVVHQVELVASFRRHKRNRLPVRRRSSGRVLYNWHRYYDPSIGRYISADPIGQRGGINVYSYVLNRPTMFVDPTGQNALVDFLRSNGGGSASLSLGLGPGGSVGLSVTPDGHVDFNYSVGLGVGVGASCTVGVSDSVGGDGPSFGVQASVDAGTGVVGGTAGLGFGQSSDPTVNEAGVSPLGGAAVEGNVGVGFGVGFGASIGVGGSINLR